MLYEVIPEAASLFDVRAQRARLALLLDDPDGARAALDAALDGLPNAARPLHLEVVVSLRLKDTRYTGGRTFIGLNRHYVLRNNFV